MTPAPDAASAWELPLPIIIGGDIGAYSLARSFHEAWGLTSVVVATVLTGAIRHSRIVEPRVEPNLADDQALVAVVREIAKQHEGRPMLLMGSADWYVEAIVRNRDAWPDVTVPYVDAGTLERATDKVVFGDSAQRCGVPYPDTTVVDLARDLPDLSELPYPVVAKAASTSDFHAVEYAGKAKVFYADSADQLREILHQAQQAQFTGQFLIQRRVRGGDDHMRVATCFVGHDGVEDLVVGRVLVEEHTPGALGNPAAIVVEDFPDIEQGMRALVGELGWSGHANFDVKWDPDTGSHVFFELNPRLGRSNYYLSASGTNPTRALVREHFGVEPPPAAPRTAAVYSILPLPLLLRYVHDRGTRARLRRARWRRGIQHPLWYPADRNVRRWLYVQIAKLNQYRKFMRFYPPRAARMVA